MGGRRVWRTAAPSGFRARSRASLLTPDGLSVFPTSWDLLMAYKKSGWQSRPSPPTVMLGLRLLEGLHHLLQHQIEEGVHLAEGPGLLVRGQGEARGRRLRHPIPLV